MDTRVSLDKAPHTPRIAAPGEVLHLFLQPDETLICAYTKNGGAAGIVAMSAVTQVGVAKELMPLISGITSQGTNAKDLIFKLVGPANGIRLVRQFLFDRQMSCLSDFDTGGGRVEIYFYAASGRLRVSSNSAGKDKPADRRRVLIVDDSQTMRRILKHILSEHPELEVVGEADRPTRVEKMIDELQPDVVTLDIHMPEMDGITLLKRLMARKPLPVVMVSSVSFEEGVEVLKALELGAVDYIEKPKHEDFEELGPALAHKVLQAARAHVRPSTEALVEAPPKAAPHERPQVLGPVLNPDQPIVIGASTGGTEAIKEVLVRLPKDIPPILIAQHIPGVYSRAFAARMNDLCAFPVREASSGEPIVKGAVLIAPGGFQMAVRKGEQGPTVQVGKGLYPSSYEPSADLLFESAAEIFGAKAIGIILTGMGADGAHGLLKLRQIGAHTIAQDQKSCVVFGMPRVAIEMGAAEVTVPLDRIADQLIQWLAPLRKAA